MSEKRFVCIDIGYGDNWYITDNGKRLSEIEIVDLLNEQQATIRKLQDLCGESDGENAKLRLKNKELQDKIDMLCEKYDYPNEKDKTKVVKNDK